MEITKMVEAFPDQNDRGLEAIVANYVEMAAKRAYEAHEVIGAANRFRAGFVPKQSKRRMPSVPEFIAECESQREYARIREDMAALRRQTPVVDLGAKREMYAAHGCDVLMTDISRETAVQMYHDGELMRGSIYDPDLRTLFTPERQGEIPTVTRERRRPDGDQDRPDE